MQAEAAAAEIKDLQTALADSQFELKAQEQKHDDEIEALVSPLDTIVILLCSSAQANSCMNNKRPPDLQSS